LVILYLVAKFKKKISNSIKIWFILEIMNAIFIRKILKILIRTIKNIYKINKFKNSQKMFINKIIIIFKLKFK